MHMGLESGTMAISIAIARLFKLECNSRLQFSSYYMKIYLRILVFFKVLLLVCDEKKCVYHFVDKRVDQITA